MNKAFIIAAILALAIMANCHQIDRDCYDKRQKSPVPDLEVFPASVQIRISRDYEPYPLDTGLSPVHETVQVDYNVTKVITFNGDDHHIQDYNPRELFIDYDGSMIYASMANYLDFNYSGKVNRTLDCVNWNLTLYSFNETQKYKFFGVKFKNSDLTGVPPIIPIITRDLIRLELQNPFALNGPDYDNQCAFFAHVKAEEEKTHKDEPEIGDSPHSIPSNLMIRHVRRRVDMLGQDVDWKISDPIKISNLEDSEERILQFKIDELPQMPPSIRVPRNLSLILHGGKLTMTMAWMEHQSKPFWVCNTQVKPVTQLVGSMVYFSQYMTDNGKVIDYIEFIDDKPRTGAAHQAGVVPLVLLISTLMLRFFN